MKETILLLSSDYTGSGHKSVAHAIIQAFPNPQKYEIVVKDGFAFGGEFGLFVSKIYAYVSSRFPLIWKLMWKVFSKYPQIPTFITRTFTHKNCLKTIQELNPALIVSIHPSYNNHVIDLLQRNQLQIPFVIVILDLVSISPLWIDKRADWILCATEEGKRKCLAAGVSEDQLKVMGFPLRSEFCTGPGKENQDLLPVNTRARKMELLLISGGYGGKEILKTAKLILNHLDCKLNILAGRNISLKKRLERKLKRKYSDSIEIFGFVNNIKDFMLLADVIICRGSPNVMLESVACQKPIIIYYCCPGQEEGNDQFIARQNLGISCLKRSQLIEEIQSLFQNQNEKLMSIQKSQKAFYNPQIPKNYGTQFIHFIECWKEKAKV